MWKAKKLKQFEKWLEEGHYFVYGYTEEDSTSDLFELWVTATYGNDTTAECLRREREYFTHTSIR